MEIRCETIAQRLYKVVQPCCCMHMSAFLHNSPDSFDSKTGNIIIYASLYSNRKYSLNARFCPFCGTEITTSECYRTDK